MLFLVNEIHFRISIHPRFRKEVEDTLRECGFIGSLEAKYYCDEICGHQIEKVFLTGEMDEYIFDKFVKRAEEFKFVIFIRYY